MDFKRYKMQEKAIMSGLLLSGNQTGDIGFARQPCRHVTEFADIGS